LLALVEYFEGMRYGNTNCGITHRKRAHAEKEGGPNDELIVLEQDNVCGAIVYSGIYISAIFAKYILDDSI
jgi:hypothetical protein